MDFKEYLIKRNKSGKEILYTVLLYIAAVILSVIILMVVPPELGGINFLLAAGAFYGAYYLSAKFNREFEYVITDDCVDIDVIYNRNSRKRLISFSIKDAHILASANDESQKHLLNGVFDNEIDATTNRKDAVIYFAIVDKNGRTLVKFEPPYAALEILKRQAPSKVIISEV